MAKKISTRPLCFATLRPHRLSKLRLGKLVPLNEEEPESSTDFILMASWHVPDEAECGDHFVV